MEVAVVGTDDFVTGFRLAGVKRVETAPDHAAAEEALARLARDKEVGVIVLHEDTYQGLSNRLKKNLDALVSPVLVRISATRSEDLRKLMKKSFGVDLWEKKP